MPNTVTGKPSKQRRLIYQAPQSRRRKFLSCTLSPDLRKRYRRRNFPVRKGDTVKVTRGDFEGVEAKITDIDTQSFRVFVEGVTREKVAGTTQKVSIHASKVMITFLNLDDKWRADAIKRSHPEQEKEATPPAEEAA